MSWEAYRWTAKSPSELLYTLGPHGVDDLIRQAMSASWRELPDDRHTFEALEAAAREVFNRNVRVWKAIKQPSPAAFFENLLPKAADGYVRQAMVVCWMMMPRTGGRKVPDALKIVTEIFERNIAAWAQDNATFTGKKAAKRKQPAPKAKKNSKPKKAKRPAKGARRRSK